MTLQDLNKRLVDKAEQAINFLFKGEGKFSSGRFSIGSITGEAGDSLFVYLRTGRFKDAATGDHGDLLELFSLKYGSKQSGIDAAYSFLGINNPTTMQSKKVIPWKKPEKDWTQLTENPKVLTYLTEEREIPIQVLNTYKVSARNDKEYAFVTFTHDEKPVPCGVNYIGIKRTNGKKSVSQSKNPLSVLFGHQLYSGGKRLIITEGQIDCLSFAAACQKEHVVSIPFGASDLGWIENSWDFIVKYKEIYLAFDNDEAGQKAKETVAKRLGYERCRSVNLPANYKDANEALIEGYDLSLAIDSAVEFKPDKLVDACELVEEAIERMGAGRREDQGTPFMGWEEEESINFRLRPREMTIYTGHPNSGKSNCLYQLVAFLIFSMKEKVVVASLEEDAEDILGLIMIHALAHHYDKDDVNVKQAFLEVGAELKGMLYFYKHRNRAPFEEVLKTAEFVIRKHGAKHFIMDSVAKTDLNIEDNTEANKFVGMITTSMNDTGAHYHVVAHPRKGTNQDIKEMPGMNEIKGAASFGIETFNCITVWRNYTKEIMMTQAIKYKDKGGFKSKYVKAGEDSPRSYSVEDCKKMPDTYLWVNKQKVGGQVGRYEAYYNSYNYRISRSPVKDTEPFAKEIYTHFIENDGKFSTYKEESPEF